MTTSPQQVRVRQAVLLGLFVGTAVGLGFLLAGVPNVELMTLTVVLAGAALGPAGGFVAGVLAEASFSLANPLGAALPVLLASQVLGIGLAGLVGGVVTPLVLRWPLVARVPAAAVLGGSVTLVFDALTNLATAVTMRADPLLTLWAGVPFALLHIGSNAAIFAVLWPALAPRVRGLRQPTLRAGAVAWFCAALLAPAADAAPDPVAVPADPPAAPSDTAAAAVDTTAAMRALGWQRSLWDPFFAGFVDDLVHRSPWTSVSDGAFGARVQLFGEPGSSPMPVILRWGLPVQTGHRFVDDAHAVLLTGYRLGDTGFGRDGRGGMEGVVEQAMDDPTPGRAWTDARFHARSRDDLYRSLHLLTADAPWRAQLAIEEQLDVEGYDFRVPGETRYDEIDQGEAANYPGHASFRSGLGLLQRNLPDGSRITVGIENVRKLKSLLPAFDLDHQDLWLHRAGADWRHGNLRAAAFWIDADVDWDRPTGSGNPPPQRHTESGREGLILAAGPVQATLETWDVSDTGADAAWAGESGGPRQGRGEQASVVGTHAWTMGAFAATAAAEAWWDSRVGWRPAAEVAVQTGGLGLSVARGGRAPRSDEWLTAWRFDVPGGTPMVWRPGDDLAAEKTWRAEASAAGRLVGLDLAAALALRRLEDGLGWRPDAPGAASGQTANGLDLDSHTLRLSVGHERRFLGWIRLGAEASLRGWTQEGDVRVALPPRRDWRLSAKWENHFFQEDGILEAAWFVAHRGAMEDPWYLAAPVELAAYTLHDAYLGFRLVGAQLGVAFLNVLDTRAEYSAGALSPGREMRWRLHWTFAF